MTIKELCKEEPRCKYCLFQSICPYNIGYMDKPLSDILEVDNDTITNAIIETAKRLTENEVDNND